MMVTLGLYVRRGQRLFRHWMANPRLHALAQGTLYISAGFALSAASLASCSLPLSLGLLLAMSGWPAVLVSAGSLGGYLLFWGSAGAQGALWVALGLITALLLGSRRIAKEAPLLLCAVGALIVATSGLFFQIFQGDDLPIDLYLLRVAAAPLSAYLFLRAMERRDPITDWLVCGVGVLALAQIVPLPYWGLGYVAAAMLAAGGAFPAAALGGLALDLARVTPVPMTAALCLAWLVRMLPLRQKWLLRLAPAAIYLAVMTLCGLWDMAPLPGLFLGGILSFLLPAKPGLSHRRGETGFAQVRLEMAANVLSQTEQLLTDTPDIPIDEQALIARAADRACGSCPCRKTCREDPSQLPAVLLHKPLGNGEDLPIRCRKPGRLLAQLRHAQEQLRSIRADRDRQAEYRTSVCQQYRFLSEFLQELSDELPRRGEPGQAWYQPELAVCTASRENVGGDRCFWFAGTRCKYYVLLLDGMGTGSGAAQDAKTAGTILRKMLCAGLPAKYALRSVNSICALRGQAGAVTMDLAELQLDTGKATLYKWGAAPSYLISRGEPIKIGIAGPPPGLSVTDAMETVERLSLRRGETLVMLSDGAGGEDALRQAWITAAEPPGELAARILENSRGEETDDATVAVVRLGSVPTS